MFLVGRTSTRTTFDNMVTGSGHITDFCIKNSTVPVLVVSDVASGVDLSPDNESSQV
jgi:hypothetical protein